MEHFDRGERRYQIERLKAKRKNYWGYPLDTAGRQEAPRTPEGMSPEQLGKLINTPQMCSCNMCVNPRKGTTTGSKLSIQEIRMFQAPLHEERERGNFWSKYKE